MDAKIFTDRSGANDKIGASAVLYRNGRLGNLLQFLLGSIHQHTVYEGEAIGVLLALHIIWGSWWIQSANIYIDNRAAITATTARKSQAGHYIFDAIHKLIRFLIAEHRHLTLKICSSWIPGHKNMEGNEKADKLVKKATVEGSSVLQQLPNLLKTKLPISKSAAKQAYIAKLKKRMQLDWKKSRRYHRMKATDPVAPSSKYLKLIIDMPRKQVSLLTQLHTGHIPLAKHLHCINRNDSPLCPICYLSSESVTHFILHCPTHRNARQKLQQDTGGRTIDITKLFSTKEQLPTLFTYIAETKRWTTHLANPGVDNTHVDNALAYA